MTALHKVSVLSLLVSIVSSYPTPEPVPVPQQIGGYTSNSFQPLAIVQQQQQQPQSAQFPIVKRQSGGYNYQSPYQGAQSGAQSGGQGQSSELDSAAQNFGDGTFARPNNYQSQGSSSGGGGGGGGNVKCNRVGGGGDTYRFQCEVTRKEDITLKYSHVLWLAGSTSNAPAVEIVVPNYRVEEIIKAGFKGQSGGQGGKQPINILLQRPEKTVAAEVDVPTSGKIEPEVNIQYEPPTNTLVHYPNDQAYRPLSGPILPPARN